MIEPLIIRTKKLKTSLTNILFISDEKRELALIKDRFSQAKKKNYVFDWLKTDQVNSLEIALKNPTIYIVDLTLSNSEGIELIDKILKHEYAAPLILLIDKKNINIVEKAIEYGVTDVLVKGTCIVEQLEKAILYCVVNATKNAEIRKIKQIKDELKLNFSEQEKKLDKKVINLEEEKLQLNELLEKEKELNELKSNFVATASHEFRTPLATISSSLFLIKSYGKKNDLENQAKHISKIDSTIKNLTELLDDYLSVSKLEADEDESYELKEFNLKSFISEVQTEMELIKKPAQVIHYHHSGNEAATLNEKLLKKILCNLISNAIKFSPEEEKIEINSKIENQQLTISIKDNGIGISQENQIRLFERFYRADNASLIQGTGLGLSIVSKYTRAMNGQIEVLSAIDQGTLFTLSFPQ